ncbi:hypothetical protein [Kibdelosporangium phytohabitans]|nr:hypothetical protein [Kibdelosporangium phytohabitans]MBE1461446.1 hypothetical protein [Kibdelosporangium phytohabitans]
MIIAAQRSTLDQNRAYEYGRDVVNGRIDNAIQGSQAARTDACHEQVVIG